MTIREAYLSGREHLAAAGSAEPEIEAEVLLRHALHFDRAALFARWEQGVPAEAWQRYRDFLEQRASGRPVHYIIGEREFMGLAFVVDERVMIPRPETEVLVELVIDALRARSNLLLVDTGTGSGCIAVSLAHYLPQAAVYATDISAPALAVARTNAQRHGVADRIIFLKGDLLSALPESVVGQVDAVLSNPPYVPRAQRALLPREIRDFEPAVAMLAPEGGIEIHQRLIAASPRWLRPGGLLGLEVGAGQATAVAAAVQADTRFDRVRALRDLNGVDRVVAGERR